MTESILYHIRKIIPQAIFHFFQPIYHASLAFIGAVIYRFPSHKLKVIAVTGTKGKSSVTELVSAILEEAGHTTAVSNTIRFKIGGGSRDNLYKMSMPGRMFIQRFLRQAVKAGCEYAVIEVTSQGAAFYRHKFIAYDALIFTNLAPEHIEAHGSYENYVRAKLSIAEEAARSSKPHTVLVANADDKVTNLFLKKDFDEKRLYSLDDARPFELRKEGFSMTVQGVRMESSLSGEFNIYNELAAISLAESEGISIDACKRAIEKFTGIRGRVEKIDAGQDFTVVVDYAHTPDSLEKLYRVFKGTRRICVLGNTGGGRDTWKRDEMARIAERDCDEIILTNEDPYDDDPRKIVEDMAKAIGEESRRKKLHVIMDRREAIARALSLARTGDSVLITGKGTDPYIMGPNNTKIPWSDARVAREELEKLAKKQN
ncbi:MAG: UDP-N-acetylmuramyl-tripeptide synthetase [Patescibacteria group bacterium]|nr:UDP-N-acetylmuramyl-tripeptide synthetase [Patescibacteria group bacterium]MDE2116724.1 UDP-N-acetylmuramyl-tripeptide synthetase [Patescibacteria group bacterium]